MKIATTQAQVFTIGGFAPIISPDGEIILKLTTRGTCFPARSDGYTARSSFFQILSYPNVDNKVYIDYSDGTGWHEYAFKSNNNNRGISFRCNDSTDPTQVTTASGVYGVTPNDGFGGGQFGLHFYQDLTDPGKINTVDHYYAQERDIFIKFDKPTQLQSIICFNTVFLATFPSLAKLRNLTELILSLIPELAAFENEAVNTLLEVVSLADLGITSNIIPLWIKNSPVSRLDLSDFLVTTTTAEFETEIVNAFKNTLERLTLSSVDVNYAMPESFSELTKLENLTMRDNRASENFTFPADLSPLVNFTTLDLRGRASFPLAQLKRYIAEVPSTNKYIDIRGFGTTTTAIDFVLDNDDYTVGTLSAAYGRWNNGAPPTCIGQMKALEELTIYGSYNYSVSNGAFNLLSWGDFSGATALKEINFRWQQKMDLNFPAWLVNLTELKIFDCHASFETLQKMDDFVNSVYDFITTNASITEGNSPFRIMHIKTYRSASPLNSFHPTGIYQEPTGYVQGSANGTPTTPLEKVWVLTHQYQHTWVLKP
ncbi:MAG: hypothetical protein BM557_02220 [Flavobacterium sp. MedPE-SWcel]|uniref:hypothetical protein n=1 Tax=uncultured Flavobacterium sp. TaxID=165435 RepID=UPI00091B476A|nr:hypothetical protein [uncultured Flavobacterium sp.]OIQ22214.1 MAG: hypothetical protein BM557_02220 [Flavobacterium sp. MedPE-SWcel]